MALTMSEERFAEIREKVMERRRLAEKVKKIRSEPGEMTFSNVGDFLVFLDAQTPPEDPSPRSRRKRR